MVVRSGDLPSSVGLARPHAAHEIHDHEREGARDEADSEIGEDRRHGTGTDKQARLAVNGTGGPVTTLASLPTGGSSPTPAQNQRLASYLVAHGQYASPIGRRNLWSSALAAETGITRVAYEIVEGP